MDGRVRHFIGKPVKTRAESWSCHVAWWGGGSVVPAVSGSPGAAYHQAYAGLGDVAASGGLRDAGDETPVRPPGY